MKKLVLKLIDNYQKNISSNTKPHCRFYPTCSEYAKQCFERFNFFKATLLSVYRLIRCNPLAKGGYDPVPEKKPRLVPITNNLFYIENTYNTDRPAIGYYHYNGKALLIDAGNSDRHAKLIQKIIKKAKLPKPSLAIITHYHWDHSYALPYYNIDAIALKETKENLDKQDYSFNKKNLLEHFSDETIPLFSYDHFRLEYKHSLKKVQKPIITKVISEDTKFYLENQLIYLLKFPSNHTNDTLAVFFKEAKIIFLGDALCGKICGNDFISSQDTISQQIKYLEKLDFDLAITSHEKPLSKPEIIKALSEQLSK